MDKKTSALVGVGGERAFPCHRSGLCCPSLWSLGIRAGATTAGKALQVRQFVLSYLG